MQLCVRCGGCAGTGITPKQPSLLLLSEVFLPLALALYRIQKVLYKGLWKALPTSLLQTAMYRSASKRYLTSCLNRAV